MASLRSRSAAKSLATDGSAPRVAAYLLGIEPTDVLGPLKEFQHTKAMEEDTLKLLASINNAVTLKGERGLAEERLKAVFKTFWPDFTDQLSKVIARDKKEKPRREMRDMVEEILEYVRPRAQQRDEAASRASALEDQVSVTAKRLRMLQARLWDADRRMQAGHEKRAALVADDVAGADLAAVDAELARVSAEHRDASAAVMEHEARLMMLRQELADAKRAATTTL